MFQNFLKRSWFDDINYNNLPIVHNLININNGYIIQKQKQVPQLV